MNKFCPLPFVSIEATPMGKARACCISTEEIPDIDLRTNTLSEAFDSDYMKQMRIDFLSGDWPKNCQRCWDEEAAGRTSKRMHSIEKLKSAGVLVQSTANLQFLDLKLGNICNLKCRICGSFSSSKWAGEEIAIYSGNQTARDNLANGRWIRESPRFWEDLREIMKDVKYIEFTGGEPFLIEEHFDLLSAVVHMGLSKNIEIHYNTNLTMLPDMGLDLWPHFKEVEIAVSVDDIGKRFEYQRYGSDWNRAMDNLEQLRQLRANSKNIKLQLCLTVNVQNFYYIDEMCEWIPKQDFDFVYFNLLHSAEYFCIKNLNARAKFLINSKYHAYDGPYADEIRNLLNFMNNGENGDTTKLLLILKQSDLQRNQKFSDDHPELATAIGYE
jgi:pyruvate-formate lyase-activating enzyme